MNGIILAGFDFHRNNGKTVIVIHKEVNLSLFLLS